MGQLSLVLNHLDLRVKIRYDRKLSCDWEFDPFMFTPRRTSERWMSGYPGNQWDFFLQQEAASTHRHDYGRLGDGDQTLRERVNRRCAYRYSTATAFLIGSPARIAYRRTYPGRISIRNACPKYPMRIVHSPPHISAVCKRSRNLSVVVAKRSRKLLFRHTKRIEPEEGV